MIDAERDQPYDPRDDQPLIAFTLPYSGMIELFGPPHRKMDANDNEPGPCEYCSFRFHCGLTVFITYHFHAPTGPGGNVCATSPDIGHILKHLPIADCLFWRLDEGDADFYRHRYASASGICPAHGTPPDDDKCSV